MRSPFQPSAKRIVQQLLCVLCAWLVFALPQLSANCTTALYEEDVRTQQGPISEEEVHKTCLPGGAAHSGGDHSDRSGAPCALDQADGILAHHGDVLVPPPKSN